MKNIDLFDQYTGQILYRLYKSFPIPIPLDGLEISGYSELDEFGTASKQADICINTIKWLGASGYLNCDTQRYGASNAVLTAKGLELLKLVPESLQGPDNLGERLTKLLSGGAKVAAKAVVQTILAEGCKVMLK